MPLQQVLKTIVTVLVLTVSTSAFAKGLSCADLLAPVVPPAASALDYALSDFEGLYLEIIKDVGAAGQMEADQRPRHFEALLKKKAEFLNDAIFVVRNMAMAKIYGKNFPISVEQLFSMIMSLGVDPENYGFSVDANGRPEFVVEKPEPQPAQSSPAPQAQAPAAEENPNQGFIGFIDVRNQGDRDLPDHLKRSIGFGKHDIRRNEGPARKVGEIGMMMNEAKQLVVIDYFNRVKYTLNPQILASPGVQTDDKAMVLSFDQNAQEWFIAFQNTANPEGIIGFAMPNP